MKSEKDSLIISKILEQSAHLGDYIRQERKKRGFNQTEFGKRIGLTMRAVQTYEQGSVIPPYSVLERIKALFEVEITSQPAVITTNICPCYKFRTVGSDKQLLQIASEFSEVVKAVESGNPTESAYECADLVIATVGYMRFVLGLSETEIADIFQLMNEKNKSRGYLEKE